MTDERDEEIERLGDQCEQARVQLGGCLAAAEGAIESPAVIGDYGWSPAYQAVLELRRQHEEDRRLIAMLEKSVEDSTETIQVANRLLDALRSSPIIRFRLPQVQIPLAECPPGLFWHGGGYGFKSEYGFMDDDEQRRPLAYLLDTGEVFAKTGDTLVTPCSIHYPLAEEGGDG